MDDLIGQRGRDHESAVDGGTRLRGDNRVDMASHTAEAGEDLLTCVRIGFQRAVGLQRRIARRNLRATQELCEVINVLQAKVIGVILGVGSDLADVRYVRHAQTAGNAHFVHISIGDEGQQAAVLVLPTEATYARLAGGFEDRHQVELAMNAPVALARLRVRDVDQRLIVNRLHEAVAQRAQRRAQLTQVLSLRDMLLLALINRALINDRAIGDGRRSIIDSYRRAHEFAARAVAGANLGKLTGAAGDRICVALHAGTGIEHGAETIQHVVLLLINLLVQREGVTGRLDLDAVAVALRAGILYQGG